MANTYSLISTQTAATNVSNLTFSNIPQTYTDLCFIHSVRATGTDGADAWDMIMTTTIGSTLTTTSLRSDGSGVNWNNITDRLLRQIVPTNWTASYFSNGQIYFPNYSSSTTGKAFIVYNTIGQNSASQALFLSAGAQNSNTAISSVAFTVNGGSNFATYSSISLYGIKST